MMRELEYQTRVMDKLDAYLDQLSMQKAESDKVVALKEENPGVELHIPDFTKETWGKLQEARVLSASRAFSPRQDGIGNPVPNITLKVPTGGGKTYLAVHGVSRILSKYLNQNTGFVLWVVPNEAIYTQTLKNLNNRDHPYRKALDSASANRVKIMQRTDALKKQDAESHLCVMVLMLQASNRENQATLKMFRDRGDVYGFFPEESNREGQQALLERIPNLDCYDGAMFSLVRDSLGNALRLIRPIVVVDEGHRAMSGQAFRTLYGFNPCFVLELTATPKDKKSETIKVEGKDVNIPDRYANVLVNVSGAELDREGMIKMPLNLETRQETDWQATLTVGLERLDMLQKAATKYQADSNRYIRPIMLVQVERTGGEQRESGFIHAEDVKERLMATGLDEAEIAIKTAEKNDLKQPENQDLLSPTNRIRVIITKQALQEGWDCPFAYVLCSLAASSNQTAMTQLIGRILRQPHAEKTDVESLDSCYVITHHAETGVVVKAVKSGLEKDGLGDLTINLASGETTSHEGDIRTIRRREKFKDLQIYLPRVLVKKGDDLRALDYETDILSKIDWRKYDTEAFAENIPENYVATESQMQQIGITGSGITAEEVRKLSETKIFDSVYITRYISDIILNPFIGHEIVEKCATALKAQKFDEEELGRLAGFIAEKLRTDLRKKRDEFAESIFKGRVEKGTIQFHLRSSNDDWIMPEDMRVMAAENEKHLLQRGQTPLQLSLFTPVFEKELNADEQQIAVYLDENETIKWWHRNVAMKHYHLQGWRKDKIYPDFIFARNRENTSLVALETKGDHLAGNLDTEYKCKLMEYLTEKFDWNKAKSVGKHELVMKDGTEFEASLILMSEWETKLPTLIAKEN